MAFYYASGDLLVVEEKWGKKPDVVAEIVRIRSAKAVEIKREREETSKRIAELFAKDNDGSDIILG